MTQKLELTGRIDQLRLDIAKMLEDKNLPEPKRFPLEEILDLLTEAAHEAEEAGL